jgi:hypothetical protein
MFGPADWGHRGPGTRSSRPGQGAERAWGFGVVNGHVVLQADATRLGGHWPQDGTGHNGYCQEQSPHSKPRFAQRPLLTSGKWT